MQTKSIFSLLMAAALVAGCNPPQSGFEVSNDSDAAMADKAVVLDLNEVEDYLPGEIGENHIEVVDEEGNQLPAQCDDLDGDGQWDELAFLVDLEANEQKRLYFNAVPEEELPDFPKRTNIRFGNKEKPYEEVTDAERLESTDSESISGIFQMEGPAWENDKVGFRNYYDARNGMDIFGKQTSDMALDSAGIRGQNYHELDDWGMDILKVGSSLGAGAIGIRIGDEVTRVGECEKGTYRFITEGPVRAMLELGFEGVPVDDRRYDITHRISIYAGDLFYRSKVFVDGLQGDEDLVTGIVNMEQKEAFEMEQNGFKIIASHGEQGMLEENLGMALLVPGDDFIEFWKSPDDGDGIVETHMVAIGIEEDRPAEYAFFSGWEYQDEGFRTRDYFEQQLTLASEKLGGE
ncbi:MAG: DUF4861 domain-containing protein [Marinilabilia sp.]